MNSNMYFNTNNPKPRMYMRGGKLFYQVGGKLVPKYQIGDYDYGPPEFDPSKLPITGSTEDAKGGTQGLDANRQGSGFMKDFLSNKENVATAGSFLGTTLSSFSGNRKSGYETPGGKYTRNALSGYDNTGLSDGLNKGLSTAAALDPTGTALIVKAAVDVGKGASNLIKNEDEDGIAQSSTQQVVGDLLDPIGWMQDSYNVMRKKGFSKGLQNLGTFGVTGRNDMIKDRDAARLAERNEEARMSYGQNVGNYRNDSIYAQDGAYMRNAPMTGGQGQPTAEIEDGELIIGDPSKVQLMGDARSTLDSKFATKVVGDKHGEDTDGDGLEGIPVISNTDSYIASDYLGVNGKRAGKGNPSVAKTLEPVARFMHNAEKNPFDKYKNNPVAIAIQKRQMEKTIAEAERNKYKEKIASVARKKNSTFEDMLATIADMPKENLTPDETLILEGVLKSQTQQPSKLDQIAQANPELAGKPQQNNNTMGFNNYYNRMGGYNRYQAGGAMPPMGGQEQGPPESGAYAQELAGQAEQAMGADPMAQMGMGEPMGMPANLSPEVENMFNQLPPEMQEQVMQLPPDQMEMAIITMFEDAAGGGMQQGMEGDPMGGMPGDIDPMAAMEGEMGMEGEMPMDAEQAALMRMGGYNQYKGGGMMKKGCKVKYKSGGRMMEGTFRGYDNTGSMIID